MIELKTEKIKEFFDNISTKDLDKIEGDHVFENDGLSYAISYNTILKEKRKRKLKKLNKLWEQQNG